MLVIPSEGAYLHGLGLAMTERHGERERTMKFKKTFLLAALAGLILGISLPALANTAWRLPAGTCVNTSTNVTQHGGYAETGSTYTGTMECPIIETTGFDHNDLTTLNMDTYDGSSTGANSATPCVVAYDLSDSACDSTVYSSNGTGGSTTLTNSYVGSSYIYLPLTVLTDSTYDGYYAWVDVGIAANSSVEGLYLNN